MRVGEVGMDIRDQDECKAAKILGSISSTPCPHPSQTQTKCAAGTFHRQGGIGRGYRRPDMRVGEVGLHMRDAKQQNLGSISSPLMSSPMSNPAR